MRLLRLLPVVLGVGLASVVAQDGKALARNDGLSPRYADLVDRGIDPRDLASEIWNDIKNAATCTACEVTYMSLFPSSPIPR